MKPAHLFRPLDNLRVQCLLCAHECIVHNDARGRCQVRYNENGTLMTMVGKRLSAMAVDPVEKKPLYHFFPGTLTLSVATPGCNFFCRFCQNSDIAQGVPRTASVDEDGLVDGHTVSAEDVVDTAAAQNCRSISFTYSEPTVYFEQAMEIGKLAREKGLKNIFVSNGYLSEVAVSEAAIFLDAVNIDIKAFSDDFYRKYCGARLTPVLETARRMKEAGVWVEITTLVIPGLNDGADELRALAAFIHNTLGADTPWHLSRFHPAHRMLDMKPTPGETLVSLSDMGYACGLRHIYIGNLSTDDGGRTCCSNCGGALVERSGFRVTKNILTDEGLCPFCGGQVSGRF